MGVLVYFGNMLRERRSPLPGAGVSAFAQHAESGQSPSGVVGKKSRSIMIPFLTFQDAFLATKRA
jgi:hypothetical protein